MRWRPGRAAAERHDGSGDRRSSPPRVRRPGLWPPRAPRSRHRRSELVDAYPCVPASCSQALPRFVTPLDIAVTFREYRNSRSRVGRYAPVAGRENQDEPLTSVGVQNVTTIDPGQGGAEQELL